MTAITITTGINGETKEPLITMHWADQWGTVTAEVAREFALKVLAAVARAECDLELYHHVRESGQSEERAGIFIHSLRQKRDNVGYSDRAELEFEEDGSLD